eukprot:3344943-Pyramimonas_sp.AAC.1
MGRPADSRPTARRNPLGLRGKTRSRIHKTKPESPQLKLTGRKFRAFGNLDGTVGHSVGSLLICSALVLEPRGLRRREKSGAFSPVSGARRVTDVVQQERQT